MTKDKTQAKDDAIKNIMQSWTYEKMTQDERERLGAALNSAQACDIMGDYYTRRAAFQLAYFAFLQGIGYTGPGWREDGADIALF